jgi:uncharacterized short protein YbdD (DUF466 family)
MSRWMSSLDRGWRALRRLLGDDAYDRYLEHFKRRHAGEAPLGRAEFYRSELDRRFNQVNRCC